MAKPLTPPPTLYKALDIIIHYIQDMAFYGFLKGFLRYQLQILGGFMAIYEFYSILYEFTSARVLISECSIK